MRLAGAAQPRNKVHFEALWGVANFFAFAMGITRRDSPCPAPTFARWPVQSGTRPDPNQHARPLPPESLLPTIRGWVSHPTKLLSIR